MLRIFPNMCIHVRFLEPLLSSLAMHAADVLLGNYELTVCQWRKKSATVFATCKVSFMNNYAQTSYIINFTKERSGFVLNTCTKAHHGTTFFKASSLSWFVENKNGERFVVVRFAANSLLKKREQWIFILIGTLLIWKAKNPFFPSLYCHVHIYFNRLYKRHWKCSSMKLSLQTLKFG